MDKYTKFILTMIAVALFGINYHLFGGDIISSAHAYSDIQKVALCDENGRYCADVKSGGWEDGAQLDKALVVTLSQD